MKRREETFMKALGDIPQSYIEELTAWQAAHAPASESDTQQSLRGSDEPVRREENITMNQTNTQSAEINTEAGIPVRKLRPITAGIFASLAACAVLAIGICTGFFHKNDTATQPGFAPDISNADSFSIEDAARSVQPADIGEMPETLPIPDDSSFAIDDSCDVSVVDGRLEADDDQILTVFSCLGRESDFPEIESDSGMIFTSMDDLRPVLESVPDSDMPVKGVQHTEPVFQQGRHVLVLKIDNSNRSWSLHLHSLMLTEDWFMHANVMTYFNANDTENNTCPEEFTHFYMLLSIPGTVQDVQSISVEHTVFYSTYENGANYDPLLDDYSLSSSLIRLEYPAVREAEAVFSRYICEMYSTSEIETDGFEVLGNATASAPIPEDLMPFALRITEGIGAYITAYKVPYDPNPKVADANIFIKDTADGDARLLMQPYKYYSKDYLESVFDSQLKSGTRLTILLTDQISAGAKLASEPTDQTPYHNIPVTDADDQQYNEIVNNPDF